jgi:hypothetical protein
MALWLGELGGFSGWQQAIGCRLGAGDVTKLPSNDFTSFFAGRALR